MLAVLISLLLLPLGESFNGILSSNRYRLAAFKQASSIDPSQTQNYSRRKLFFKPLASSMPWISGASISMDLPTAVDETLAGVIETQPEAAKTASAAIFFVSSVYETSYSYSSILESIQRMLPKVSRDVRRNHLP